MSIIPIQQAFDKEIPNDVRGNSEYILEAEILQNMDRLLRESGAEDHLITSRLKDAESKAKKESKTVTYKQQVRIQDQATLALRATVLRKYLCVSYRHMSRILALAPLYQWFCGLNRFAGCKVPAKSILQSYETGLSEEMVRR